MSPPANRVQVVAGSKASAAAGAGQAGRQRPVRERLDAVDAEERRVAPRQRPDLRPDRVGAQEGEPLAVLGEVGGEGLRVRGEDQARGVGRAIDAERAQDRVGLALDELERRCSGRWSRPGRPSAPSRSVEVGRRPEVRDRDDRDVGELGRRGRRRGCLGRSRGGAVRRRSRRRSRSVAGVAVATADDGPALALDAAPRRPTWPAASTATSTARTRPSATGSGFRFTGRSVTEVPRMGRQPAASPSPDRGTPRPGGRTGRREMRRWRTRPDSNRRSPA